MRGDRRSSVASPVTSTDGAALFDKPLDIIGSKTISDHPTTQLAPPRSRK